MAFGVPKLDIYFVDFSADISEKHVETNRTVFKDFVKDRRKGTIVQAIVASMPLAITSMLAFNTSIFLSKVAIDTFKELKRIIEANCFYVIKTADELGQFENACGNDWVTGERALKQKQYYIRHPKKSARNLLIESQCFYEYIEREEKDELIDYIFSHCRAKSIQITRTIVSEAKGKANVSAEAVNVETDVNFGKSVGNFYSYTNPNGSKKTQPREEYFWLDKSIMRSISNLEEGASITQTYESDYRFGMTAREASAIGLDLNWHKKFAYTIHIEC